MLQQIFSHPDQRILLFGQDGAAALAGTVDDSTDLGVDLAGHFLGIGAGLRHGAPDKDLVGIVVKDHGTQLFAHAVLGDHGASDGGGALQIVGGAGGDIAQHQLFGHAPAQTDGNLLGQLAFGPVALVLLRQGDGHTSGSAAGDNGDLMDRVGSLQLIDDDGVTGLVVGGQPACVLGDHTAFLLGACDDLKHGLVQVVVGDKALFAAGSQQSGLVHQIFQIGAGKTSGGLGQIGQGNIFRQRLVAGVDAQNGLTALDVGMAHIHLTVKAAGAQQGGVQNVHTVGGSQHDDSLVGGESVHFHQQLVQGLLTLVVTAAQTGAALTAHRVDLVNKDDGRGVLLGLIEQVAHTGSTYTHIKLHKVGTRDGQEMHTGLTGHGTGQQSLAGTRRAHQQHTLGNAGAQINEPLGVFQELDDLLQLGFFLVGTGHIIKGHLFAVLLQRAGAGLAEACGVVSASAATAALAQDQEVPQQTKDQQNDHIGREGKPPGSRPAQRIIVILDDTRLVLLVDLLVHIPPEDLQTGQRKFRRLGFSVAVLIPQQQGDLVLFGLEIKDLLLIKQGAQLCVSGTFVVIHLLQNRYGRDQNHKNQNVKYCVAQTEFLQASTLLSGLIGSVSLRRPTVSVCQHRGGFYTFRRNPDHSPPQKHREW